MRTRSEKYLSPEYLNISRALEDIRKKNLGDIDPQDADVEKLMFNSNNIVKDQCDIFSIGVILYRCLLGIEPDENCPI